MFAGISKLTAPLGEYPLNKRIRAGRKDASPAAPGILRGPMKKLPLVGRHKKCIPFLFGILKRNFMTDQGGISP
jgi:hypothetical protein